MTLIDIGTKVKMHINVAEGIITAICIRDQEYVTYEITYSLNGEPKTAWCIPKEFTVSDSNYMITVGFKTA